MFTLSVILSIFVVLLPALAFAPSFLIAATVSLVAGLFFGPIWSVSRAMVSEFTPREIEAQSFSFYTLAERFATLIGPVVWSIILVATAESGSTSYSYALVGMGTLVLFGLLVIRKMKTSVS